MLHSYKRADNDEVRHPNNLIVPTLNNVDDIFEILSNKIAKYCQVLADLTNCEVFFKAQLPQPLNKTTTNVLTSYNHSDLQNQKYNSENNGQLNLIKRSVYWGTNKMLFAHSHSQGLRFDKKVGDSLIKIMHHSFLNDADDLVDEILVADPLEMSLANIKNVPNNKPKLNSNQNQVDSNKSDSSSEKIQIKDCFISLKRINDCTYDKYLDKFENSNNNIDALNTIDFNTEFDMPTEFELYDTTANKSNHLLKKQNEETNLREEDEEEENEEDEKTLLEKNCFNLNEENVEDYYTCEMCTNSYKHLTQLKVGLFFKIFLIFKTIKNMSFTHISQLFESVKRGLNYTIQTSYSFKDRI